MVTVLAVPAINEVRMFRFVLLSKHLLVKPLPLVLALNDQATLSLFLQGRASHLCKVRFQHPTTKLIQRNGN